MTERKRDDESVSIDEQVARLDAERAAFEARRDEVAREVRRLRDAEDPAAGVYHAQEIFRLSQEKLRLDTEIEFRRRRAARLLMPDPLHGPLQ
ncbi:hypothetical protein [Desulfocurvus sp.]|jgi:hypothetical protein|uniref:hypothetical protein n=1 Tax=Desulfocurvus sp. TaxID=2871698 RepID=UPI0025BFD2F5|nr:hypothetical protein [Desulfocurvus sp.]MCK9239383.1 hypothetical protein [Desulfocurvus sp.]